MVNDSTRQIRGFTSNFILFLRVYMILPSILLHFSLFRYFQTTYGSILSHSICRKIVARRICLQFPLLKKLFIPVVISFFPPLRHGTVCKSVLIVTYFYTRSCVNYWDLTVSHTSSISSMSIILWFFLPKSVGLFFFLFWKVPYFVLSRLPVEDGSIYGRKLTADTDRECFSQGPRRLPLCTDGVNSVR